MTFSNFFEENKNICINKKSTPKDASIAHNALPFYLADKSFDSIEIE